MGEPTTTTIDQLHEELECPVCVRLLFDPVTTPCGHSLCRSCLLSILDRDEPKCPLCRTVYYSGLRDTPVSLSLQEVIRRLYPDEYRAIGEEAAAVHRADTNGPRDIPLFVLCPVLPYEKMNLNIFEPRYRLLIRRAMESNRRFGVAGMRGTRIADVITEVEIERCETTPDGRYMITISGLSRYSHESISNMDGYAVAQGCKPYEDDEPTEEDRQEIEKLMADFHGSGEDGAAVDDDDDDDDDDDGNRDACTDRPAARTMGLVDIWYKTRLGREALYPRPAPDDVCATSWFAALIAYSAEMSDRAVLKAQMSMLRSKSVKSRFLRGIDTVEARAKAKKIQEFLDGCRVLASYGHVRDLPPKAGSIDPENGFAMKWEALQHAEKHINALQEALRDDPSVELLLATDPDREGEAIAWHVLDLLKERGVVSADAENVRRITFTEVTKDAVTNAMSAPRKIDERLVQAYLARRALDYLLGFHLSPILWRKLPGATSAGRVQSVALRLVCEREDEIDGFERNLYWTVHGVVRLPDGSTVRADAGREFETLEEAEEIKAALERAGSLTVARVSKKRTSRQPQAPFTTSTLQQESNSKLGFGASQTMQLAQELYEGGMITYMRTDSFSMASSAVDGIRHVLKTKFGDEYVPETPKVFARRKSANAQEAHEAVRPTDPAVTPQAVSYKGYGSAAIKLYELIRNRALASQAENAAIDGVSVTFAVAGSGVDGESIELKATGSKVAFPGYLDVLGREAAPSGESVSNFLALTKLEEGQVVAVDSGETAEHATKPPPRFTEGSLIKAMEEHGIGRPSTYAPTLKLLYARNYVKSSKKRLHAEPIGRILTSFLKQYAPEYVDYAYTSTLEDDFDRISHGDQDWVEVMRLFWSQFRQATEELSGLSGTEVLDALNEDMGAYLFGGGGGIDGGAVTDGVTDGASVSQNHRECPSCKAALSLKLSHKGGPFIGCSQYPTCSYTRPLPSADDDFVPTTSDDLGNTFKSLNIAEQYGMRGPVRLLGTLPTARGNDGGNNNPDGTSADAANTANMIFVRQGPYGPYIQVGLDKDPSMKRVPLPKDSKPRSLTLKYALSMLELPRTLGDHPDTGAPIEVRNGKFGPFILHGSHMRSIPKDLDPLDLTLEEALNLLKLSSENKKFSASSSAASSSPSSRSGRRPPSGSPGRSKKAATADAVSPPPSVPPRARSAYQFFLKDHLSKEKMKNGKEKMKIMGETWKALPDAERGAFQTMAEDDVLRVRIQEASLIEPTLEAWESLDADAKRALRGQLAGLQGTSPGAGVSAGKTSKPASAYTLFMQDVSEQIKREKGNGDDANRGSFMTLVAKRWRALSDFEKAKYYEASEQR